MSFYNYCLSSSTVKSINLTVPSQQIVYNFLKENVMVAQANSQAVKILEVADDPRLSKGVKEFLKVLNSGAVALEKLTALVARQVLVDAQASVSVDLSGIEESQKTITADGYSITLNIVRPEGIKASLSSIERRTCACCRCSARVPSKYRRASVISTSPLTTRRGTLSMPVGKR
ncbi:MULTISPECIES: hypothetical protein [unclassified Nostoc]|uniref:hypothetical protein n=1 Tax=unclassified Nostoc TaxID=2593658 RepID=UPI001D1DF5B6|nr:hypothetical protein [Nostoc sp. JL23]MBN3877537.1 hypothetical protein [Nostoc sp. JL23]